MSLNWLKVFGEQVFSTSQLFAFLFSYLVMFFPWLSNDVCFYNADTLLVRFFSTQLQTALYLVRGSINEDPHLYFEDPMNRCYTFCVKANVFMAPTKCFCFF